MIRVNAGDCFEITLENERSRPSGINIGEVLYNPQDSYGGAIGFNVDSNVPAGGERTYRYYADRDLGLVATLNLGDILSVEQGAFAGVVVEPEGATITEVADRPDGSASGLQADITTPDGVTWREFVALFNDQDRRIGQNAMPYPQNVENNNAISYAAEPLSFRGLLSAPADVFKSIDAETGERVWGDPRNVIEVQAGTPLIYRVGNAWGNQAHVPTLEGHRWYFEPGMAGSEQMFNDVLAPGEHKNFIFVGGAGGDIAAPGDYLFLDRRQPFLEGGMWNILRVTE